MGSFSLLAAIYRTGFSRNLTYKIGDRVNRMLPTSLRPSTESEGNHPVAHPFTFERSGPYSKSFDGSGFGVVFEDDGETGYFYATDEKHATIFDALHLYNPRDPNRLKAGEEGFIVRNGAYLRAGLFYNERFQSVIDFKNRV